MYAVLSPLLTVLAEEAAPEPEDVVAGWMGFAVFIGLIVAVAVLGWSLTKHLKKAQRSADEGAFGAADVRPDARRPHDTESPTRDA